MALPLITNANPTKISEFSETLSYCVQALETMNKLSEVNGNIPVTQDKLAAIRGDLVRNGSGLGELELCPVVRSHTTLDKEKPKLCFNCATSNHHAAECFSKKTCLRCHKRHHTSICDSGQTDSRRQTLMTASRNNEGILPVVTIKIDGITCRALIDTDRKGHVKRKQDVQIC